MLKKTVFLVICSVLMIFAFGAAAMWVGGADAESAAGNPNRATWAADDDVDEDSDSQGLGDEDSDSGDSMVEDSDSESDDADADAEDSDSDVDSDDEDGLDTSH